MVMFTKEIGSATKLKVTEYTLTWMEPNTLVNGKKINSMEKVKKLGLMEQCTREIMF